MNIGIVSVEDFEILKARYQEIKQGTSQLQIDPNMIELVTAINKLPGVVSVSSCQGHRGIYKARALYLSVAVTEQGKQYLSIFDRAMQAFVRSGITKHGVSINLRYLRHENDPNRRYPAWTISSDSANIDSRIEREHLDLIALLKHEIDHAVIQLVEQQVGTSVKTLENGLLKNTDPHVSERTKEIRGVQLRHDNRCFLELDNTIVVKASDGDIVFSTVRGKQMLADLQTHLDPEILDWINCGANTYLEVQDKGTTSVRIRELLDQAMKVSALAIVSIHWPVVNELTGVVRTVVFSTSKTTQIGTEMDFSPENMPEVEPYVFKVRPGMLTYVSEGL